MDSLSVLFAVGLGCVAAVLGVQFIIDIAVQRLPRILSYVGLVLYAVFVVGSEPGDAAGLRGLLVGLLLMTAITGLLVMGSRGAFGIGDFHLSPLLGALVGWYSPTAVLVLWIVAAVLGSFFAVSALIVRRIRRDSMIPYGPFLILGSLVSTVWIACR
jgi:leader peptidase (prepilin peptidase)/N-methyltransferase